MSDHWPASAYIHIPFCRHRCFYCDFPISVLAPQQRGETSQGMAAYVAWLTREIRATPPPPQPLNTVFFGGGTPSLLSVDQLQQILATLENHMGISPDAEISMEMDPGTFALEQLVGFLEVGINRISLGVQALDDQVLATCGRSHRVADIYQTVTWLHQQQVANWSLDLISGLPNQTLKQWQAGLMAAVDLGPHHISVYDLTIEPKTVFAHRYQPGLSPLPSDEQTAAMYRLTQQHLTAQGYDHYEISNYAQPGHRCRHNLTYWQNQAYYGFGMGATSYTEQRRVSRPRTLQEYGHWVDSFEQAQGQLSHPLTSPREQLLDRLMVGLRLRAGISSLELRSLCDEATWRSLYQRLQPHLQNRRIVIETDPPAEGLPPGNQAPGLDTTWRLRLTDPEGFLFSNQVLVDCFQVFPEFVA